MTFTSTEGEIDLMDQVLVGQRTGIDDSLKESNIEAPVTWHEHITTDASVLSGKPVVRGTRLAVDFLLGLFAAGWTQEQIFESYPQVSPDALRAVFAYAAEVTNDEALHLMHRGLA